MDCGYGVELDDDGTPTIFGLQSGFAYSHPQIEEEGAEEVERLNQKLNAE